MRRYPNPWFLVPTLAAGAVGAGLGWVVTSTSCQPDTCVGWATFAAIAFGVMTMLGAGTVVVLAIRSIAEFQAADAIGEEPPGPGCEVPQDGSQEVDDDVT